MDAIFLLHHIRSDDEYADDAKLIGAYRSESAAASAVERLRDQSGFKDHPDGWDIQQWKLDEDHWEEGFSTTPDASLLILSFEDENDGSGKLTASVEANGFAGQGDAWFSHEQLRAFAEDCKVYPLAGTGPVLNGGYWNDAGSALLEVRLSIRFEPYDARGTILASVQLATGEHSDNSNECRQSATLRFYCNYDNLIKFAAELISLTGGGPDVVLRSSRRH